MMRGTKVSSWISMLTLLAMVASLLVIIPVAYGDLSPSQCKEETRLLVDACRPVILFQKPSAQCCQRVREAHLECMCPSVTSKLTAVISVQRAIKEIEGCGRPVPRNFRCGSVTTPP